MAMNAGNSKRGTRDNYNGLFSNWRVRDKDKNAGVSLIILGDTDQ